MTEASPAPKLAPASEPSAEISRKEIFALLAELPQNGTAPINGELPELQRWLFEHSLRPNDIDWPRLALYFGAHGTDEASKNSQALLQNAAAENGAIYAVASQLEADLRLYELDLAKPHAANPPAMTEDAGLRAISYGMLAVESGLHIIALAADGDGTAKAARRLEVALATSDDGLSTLFSHGGTEIAALFGAMLAARLAKIPVVADGDSARAALALLQKMAPQASSHVWLVDGGLGQPGLWHNHYTPLLASAAAINMLRIAARMRS